MLLMVTLRLVQLLLLLRPHLLLLLLGPHLLLLLLGPDHLLLLLLRGRVDLGGHAVCLPQPLLLLRDAALLAVVVHLPSNYVRHRQDNDKQQRPVVRDWITRHHVGRCVGVDNGRRGVNQRRRRTGGAGRKQNALDADCVVDEELAPGNAVDEGEKKVSGSWTPKRMNTAVRSAATVELSTRSFDWHSATENDNPTQIVD